MTEGPEERTIGDWLGEWKKEGMKPGDRRHFMGEYEATYLGMSPTDPSDPDASDK